MSLRRLTTATLALAVSLIASPAHADETAKAPLDVAMEHLAQGRFPEALAAVEAVPADDPAAAKARYVVGEVQLALGDASAAEAAFRAALEKKPDAAPALAGLGRALLAQGKADEAVEPLSKAVGKDAASARTRAWLGLARSRAGKGDEGRKDLAAASKAAPADAEVARVAVEERLDAKDVEGAAKAAAAFGRAAKGSAMGPFLTAFVLDRAGKFDEAIAAYEKALSIDDRLLDAHKDLAILCIAQNRVYTDTVRNAKAMKHFARYAELGGRDATVLSVYENLKSFLGGSASGDGSRR